MSEGIKISWNNASLTLLPDKAIYWPSQKVLFIADPHFGKAATFRKSGIPIPEQGTRDDCVRLSKLIEKTRADSLVILGDFFHARLGKTQEIHDILLRWRESFSELNIHLIRGNHDLNSGDPWHDLQIKCHQDPFKLFDLECRHIPISPSKEPYLAGHIHPGFTLKGKGKNRLRAACFHVNHSHIVLPAFGSFTGLKNIKPNKQKMLELANSGYITATDLADYLVKNYAMPFRKAYQITASIVNYAEKNNKQLEELSIGEIKKIEPKLSNDILKVFNLKNSVNSKNSYGGTSFGNIKKMIKKYKKNKK